MGAPASFAIIESGKTTLYYSQWGADNFVSFVFFGPEGAAEFIRSNREVKVLLDEVWAEAGAILNFDARRFTFYQWGQDLHPELRQILLPLMRTNWPGWDLRWAFGEIFEIAESLGFDPTACEAKDIDNDRYFEWAELTNPPEDYLSLVTIRDSSGLRDLGFQDPMSSLLAEGPGLLEAIRNWPAINLANRVKMQFLEEGVWINPTERHLSWWAINSNKPDRRREIIQARWPGWTVEVHHEGLPGHWARSGRDPAAVSVGEEGILREITRLLLGTSVFDSQRFLDQFKSQREEIEQVHPDFLNVPRPTSSVDDRTAILTRSIAEYRRTRPALPPTGITA